MNHTPDELRRRYNHTQAWKKMPENHKKELRDSWKTLDSLCKEHHGDPRILPSIANPGISIKGCVTSFHETNIKNFINMVNAVDSHIDKGETEYLLYYGEDNKEYVYETDGEWHHIKLVQQDDYEENATSITLEQHHRARYQRGEDGHMKSYIETYITRMNRMQRTRDEYGIQQMLDTANKMNVLQPTLGKNQNADVQFKFLGVNLAQKVRDHFDIYHGG